jgi:histidinol dehydrogenase
VISLAAANDRALHRLGPATIALARAEGLTGHARAIERRLAGMGSDDGALTTSS